MMREKGLLGLAVLLGFLIAVLVLPVFAAECSEWVWSYVEVTREGGNTELHLRLTSDGQPQGHSNTKWGRCFPCDDIVSVTYQTAVMSEPIDAAYECDKDKVGVDFFKVEQTVEFDQAPADFWITIKGQSAIGVQEYLLKWALNTCAGEVEWLNCQPPTAVTLRDFWAWSPQGWLVKILSWFW